MSTASLFDNPEFRADIRNLDVSSREISEKWGYAYSSTNKWRRRLADGEALPGEDGFEPRFGSTFYTGEHAAADAAVVPGESETHNADGTANFIRFSSEPWGYEDYKKFITEKGMDPERVTFSWGWTSNPGGGFWNKLNNVREVLAGETTSGPAWPVIVPGPTFVVPPIKKTPRVSAWKTAILVADTQIGFREVDGELDPFHDEQAIDVALQIIEAENPDQTVVMGDIIDLAQQSRWAQEAGFARTTQPAIDRTTLLAAQIRSATDGKIIFIEGNHDKRMQGFVETNALAAFGLRRGNLPESWPVMSLPNLLRLDEFDVIYRDAYPTSHWWVNDALRCEHGTKSNSKGSTASQYANETPHLSRAHGHTHRLEVQSKTTYDRLGAIRSMALNPGCLCRVDGAVPSVNGAVTTTGAPAVSYENWQQGLIVIRYKEGTEFFVDGLVQIHEGLAVHQGQEFAAV